MFLFGDYQTEFKGIASFAKQQHHLRRCHCKCSNVKGDPPKKGSLTCQIWLWGYGWKPWYLVNKIGGKWMFIPKYGIIGFDPWHIRVSMFFSTSLSPLPVLTLTSALSAPGPASLKVWSLELLFCGSGMLKVFLSHHIMTFKKCHTLQFAAHVQYSTSKYIEYIQDWCLIWLNIHILNPDQLIKFIFTYHRFKTSQLPRIPASRRSLRATWWTPAIHSLFHMESGNKMDENAWKWNPQPFGISEGLRSMSWKWNSSLVYKV